MKAISVLVLGALLLAAPTPPMMRVYFPYVTGFQVQNLEASQSAIQITLFNVDGSQAAQVQDAIPALGSQTYFPLPQVAADFGGSVVVESDKQIASIGNILAKPQPDGALSGASYAAPAVGSPTVYLPLLLKDGSGTLGTWFSLQNTGLDMAHVLVSYSDGVTVSLQIEPGAAQILNQFTETHTLKVFSAVITSSQPLAATVIEDARDVLFAYNGFSGGTVNPYLPLINFSSGGAFITGAQVQNAGDTETIVTITYQPALGIGTACTETQTIPSGQSKTFALHAFAGAPLEGMTTDCVGGARFVGSAQVTGNTASQPLAVIVNQLSAVSGGAYSGFAGGAQTVLLPLIMDRNSGFWTGFNVQNVGSEATNVVCTFTGSDYIFDTGLKPGEALNDLQSGKIAAGYIGSATCTASAGGQIVAVVNELGPAYNADQLLVYEGVRLP